MPTERELAWAAGFFDGEGTITIAQRVNANKGYSNYLLRMSASNTIKQPIDELQRLFGGRIIFKPRYGGEAEKHKPYWMWDIVGKQAQVVLKQLVPYFRVKTPQASIGMVFPIGKTLKEQNTPRHPLAIILQGECHKRLRELNRTRGQDRVGAA